MPDIQRFYFCTGPALILNFDAPTSKGLVRVVYQPQGRDVEYNFAIWCREETELHNELTNCHANGEVIAVDGYAQAGEDADKYYHHACRVYHGAENALPRFKPAKDHVPATEDGRPIETFSRDEIIARQSALKSATSKFAGHPEVPTGEVIAEAERYYEWLTGGNRVSLPPAETQVADPKPSQQAGNGQKPAAAPAPPADDISKNRTYIKFSAMFKAAREESKLKEFGEKLSFETVPKEVRDRLAAEYTAAGKRIAAQQPVGAKG